jgi:hypothetical protein
MFGDSNYLKKVFLDRERPQPRTIFWVRDVLSTRSYNKFINLFPNTHQNEIRSMLTSSQYEQFREDITEMFDGWVLSNPYTTPYVSEKSGLHYKMYGKDLEKTEFSIISRIAAIFNRFYGKNMDLSAIEKKLGNPIPIEK